MFRSEIDAVANTAKNKAGLMEKNLFSYLILSALAGMYIGLGSILMGCVGGTFTAAGSHAAKLVCGLVFSVALCFVTVAGAELFTGNNFVMAVGALSGTVSWGKTIKLWAVCWFGNLIGSVVVAAVFTMTGVPEISEIGAFLANTAAGKIAGTIPQLVAKGIFCNICVCLAIWCGAKLKSEGARIALNFCCVTTFVACGFEHCVANMTFLSVGFLNPNGTAVTLAGIGYNLLFVTIGNIIGGVLFLAVPYYLVSKEK